MYNKTIYEGARVQSQSNLMTQGRLKTRHIVLLVHLDAQRSVLRAAKAANMTQPGASKLLSELEDLLGVALFTRHARGIEPTWYGEIMVRHARSALAEMDRARDEILALRSGLAGQTAIGAVLNPGTGLVPAAVGLLKKRHPQILVRIEIDNSEALVSRLVKGDFDVVVSRIIGVHDASELRFEALAGELHSVIARAKHPLAGRRRLDLAALVDQAWILPPAGSLLRDRFDSMFVHRGLGVPRNVVETASLPVITSLLQSTDMLSALQREAVLPYCKARLLKVLPVALGVQMEPFGIVTRRDRQLSPSGEAMLKALREAATKMYPQTATA
jgi:DNA-binding transcriptional LysR family regulator